MTQKAMTFKELEDMVNSGIDTIQKLQRTLKGESFLQADDVSQVLNILRSMIESKVLFYNSKLEQKIINELAK